MRIYGYDVQLNEDGNVIAGVRYDNHGGARRAYPYRWNRKMRCWDNYSGDVSPHTFRIGLRRGNYKWS